jgi:prolyl oligopeptidase
MKLDYPVTREEDAVDTLAGVSFSDPYRWLENQDEEVVRWQRAQAALATAYVRRWPPLARFRALVARFSTESRLVLPRFAGRRWFRLERVEGQSHFRVVVSEEPFGTGDVVFDAAQEDGEHPPYISWISPSPDGRILAVGVCADGSERNSIRLVEVRTGRILPDSPPRLLMDSWTGGVHWLADSSGFFFAGLEGDPERFDQRVYLHRRSPRVTTEEMDIRWNGTHDYRMVVVSRDGRHAVAFERLQNPIPVAVAALSGDTPRWRPFITAIKGTVAGHVIGDELFAITDVGAPRGRLVSIPLDVADPNDCGSWNEIVPESEAVLRTLSPVGDDLYLTELVDTYARVRRVSPGNREVVEVPLPGRGALGELSFPMMNLAARSSADEFLFAFSSLSESSGVYRYVPGSGRIEQLRAPAVRMKNVVVEDRWVTASDGVRVPYHILRRADADLSRPQATLIYGYGGFNVALTPQFPGPMAAFVAAGGIFVHAHLRGGGELGLAWWEAGRMRNKQRGYEDLYAIAEDLIATGITSAGKLAVTGASNGGTMAAVAATQRPELWAAAIPRVAVLDQIGSCREPYGRQSAIEEKADIGDPAEVRRLATFSPYHLVREGVKYPAIYIDMGATDPRCPAWHGRKLAARLQKTTASSAPVLLHVWEGAGHGWATGRNIAIEQNAEWLAFALSCLGIEELPDE